MQAHRLAGLALLALLALQPALAAVGVLGGGQGQEGLGLAARARLMLDAAVAEAEKLGILDTYKDDISTAYQLLDEAAQAEAQGNITLAVRLVAQAMGLVAPMLEQVQAQLQVQEQVVASHAIGVERALRILMALNATGVPVPPDAIEALIQARHNHTMNMSHEEMVRLREKIAWSMNKHWWKANNVAAASAAALKIALAAEKVADRINESIALIENGSVDQAAHRLYEASRTLQGLAMGLERIAQAASTWGVNETIVGVILSAASAAENASSLLEEAADMLGANETEAAIEAAMEAEALVRYGVVEPLLQLNLPVPVRVNMTIAMLKHALITGNATEIAELVNETVAGLKRLLELQENGTLPAPMVMGVFHAALKALEHVNKTMGPNAPPHVRQALENALEWITSNMPMGGERGHGQGHGGHGGSGSEDHGGRGAGGSSGEGAGSGGNGGGGSGGPGDGHGRGSGGGSPGEGHDGGEGHGGDNGRSGMEGRP